MFNNDPKKHPFPHVFFECCNLSVFKQKLKCLKNGLILSILCILFHFKLLFMRKNFLRLNIT
jgi:hypothetical protein